MPTTSAIILLGLLVVLVVVGLVFWVRAAARRGSDTAGHSSHPEAPYSAEQASQFQRRQSSGGMQGGL
jgi:cytochrome c-type biogenesis protein CcmH/NrfF